MPYSLIRDKKKWFVTDNAGIRLPGKGFNTKEKARKQEIAVILSQSKRTGKTFEVFFRINKNLFWSFINNFIKSFYKILQC